MGAAAPAPGGDPHSGPSCRPTRSPVPSRPLRLLSLTAVPGLPEGDVCTPGCTSPDSGRVSFGVHTCTTTSGDSWGSGESADCFQRSSPPSTGAHWVCPALCASRGHVSCLTNGASETGPGWSPAKRSHKSSRGEAPPAGWTLDAQAADLRPQRKPRRAPPKAPTHRKMSWSTLL